MSIELERGHLRDDLLQAYLDGELASGSARGAAEHLAMCRDCQGRAEEIKSVVHALAYLPDKTLGRDLAPQVLASLRPKRWTPARWTWMLAAQAVLAAALAIWAGRPAIEGWLATVSIRLQVPETWLMEILAWPRSGWEILLGEAQSVLDLAPTLVNRVPEFSLPLTQIPVGSTVVVALLAFWLAGNGLLLLPGLNRSAREG